MYKIFIHQFLGLKKGFCFVKKSAKWLIWIKESTLSFIQKRKISPSSVGEFVISIAFLVKLAHLLKFHPLNPYSLILVFFQSRRPRLHPRHRFWRNPGRKTRRKIEKRGIRRLGGE